MPFEAGNQGGPGGARPGAGRKPSSRKAELQELLDEAVPRDYRKKIFDMLAHRSWAGDYNAAAILLGYLYGKPVTMDVTAAFEEVERWKYGILALLADVDPELHDRFIDAIEGVYPEGAEQRPGDTDQTEVQAG